MKESVAVAKEADAKKGVSPTRSDNSIHRVRNEPERQLGSLRDVIGNIRRDGGTPSVEGIATELSGMHTAQRAPALLALQQTHGNRYVQRVVALASQGEVNPEIDQAIQRARDGGQALDSKLRTKMESAFGDDFSGVRVHTDREADALNRALNAHAFTTGQDIFFRAGEYNPGGSGGRELLAHELTHVVQQRCHAVQCRYNVSQPGDAYERQADEMARKVAHWIEHGENEPQASVVLQKQEKLGLARQPEEEEGKIRAKREPTGLDSDTALGDVAFVRASTSGLGYPAIQREVEPSASGRPVTGSRMLLPKDVQMAMEETLGEDFSAVRVHVDGVAERFGGLAFTSGNDIHFASGKYDPYSQIGRELLGHELTHVVQQRHNRVPASKASGSPSIVYDQALEDEADREGARAASAPKRMATAQDKRLLSEKTAAIHQAGVMQGFGPAFLTSLGITSWEAAAQAAAVIGATAVTGGAIGSAISRGSSGVQSLTLPENVTTVIDRQSLARIAQFRIVNEYISRYVLTHPNALEQLQAAATGRGARGAPAGREGEEATAAATGGGARGAPAGREGEEATATPTAPTGAPEASAIDQEIMRGVRERVRGELTCELERDSLITNRREYLWTEDNAHDVPDRVGVSGYVILTQLEGAALEVTPHLTGPAAIVRDYLNLPEEGQRLTVRKFISGQFSGQIIESMWDDLTISVVGARPSIGRHTCGGPEIRVRTEWFWNFTGPVNSTTFVDIFIVVEENGRPLVTFFPEGTP